MIAIRHAHERGHANHGWLESWHTFSFADYHDPAHLGFRTLRVINDDTVAGGAGFDMHPHRDMEILSFVLSGALEHRDSLGHRAVMRAGEVQRISAGTGVFHSEFNPSASESVHFLQIWIRPERQGAMPAYGQKSLAGAAPGLTLIASRTGRDSSLAINQDAEVWLAKFGGGESLRHALAPGRHAWVQVAEGAVTLNGQALKAGDGAALSREGTVQLTASQSAQALLFDLD